MNKDVIYIDIEDDITAIIGKVKQSDAKIIALVPPKRVGVLQSVVNLKLLQKAASTVEKRVVIITSDSSLTALAAGVKIPVAKNLQSRPEVPHIAALKVDESDVINGQDLPVGEIAGAMASRPKPSVAEDLSNHIDLASSPATSAPAKKPARSGAKKVMPFMGFARGKKAGGKGFSIPNFDDFRKRLFLFGGIGAVLLAFLIWAIFFAPHATVTITARTTAVNVDKALTLKPEFAASDTTKLELKPNVQQIKKAVATEFDATGTKEIGNKATGAIKVQNCDSPSSFTLEAGTVLTASNGRKFTATKDTLVSGLTGSANICRNTSSHTGAGVGNVPVEAADIGPEYNIGATSFTISGVGGDVYASSNAAMTGGTRETVKVVSQEDVDKAKQQLEPQNTNDIKADLKKQFKSEEYIIIEESFIAEPGQPSASPAVGEQATRAKLTQETTFTLIGISRDDVKKILGDVVKEALESKPDQQQYSLGDKAVTFQLFQKIDGGFTANMATTAYIGPKIDTKALAKQITGKRFGEIQAIIQEIDGIKEVDIKFSPFWVTTAPAPDKVEIKFSVANDK